MTVKELRDELAKLDPNMIVTAQAEWRYGVSYACWPISGLSFSAADDKAFQRSEDGDLKPIHDVFLKVETL